MSLAGVPCSLLQVSESKKYFEVEKVGQLSSPALKLFSFPIHGYHGNMAMQRARKIFSRKKLVLNYTINFLDFRWTPQYSLKN